MLFTSLHRTCVLAIIICLTCQAGAQDLRMNPDTTVTSRHAVNINGTDVDYQVETGTQPVWDEAGKAVAYLHYTYYTRRGVDSTARPLIMSFNGGPGSASCWMHLAYTGPRVLNIDEEGFPTQPYGYADNPHSVLDVADIVYVNPVNTGYSRTIPLSGEGVDREMFFGVNADIKYLAGWLNTFVTRHGRWSSPKYLIGESYGGTRVAGLALALQEQQWMYLNGVIMVSPADYLIYGNEGVEANALTLPYYTAAAWYHDALPEALQSRDLEEILPEAEEFTINTLMPAVARGGFLEAAERKKVAERIAYYSGLTAEEALDHNLRIPTAYFWKALRRRRGGYTVGRLDSRYLGLDRQLAGSSPDYNAELTSWLHSFTPAINHYMHGELGWRTDLKYNVFGPVHPWDQSDNTTREDLRKAMAENPYLNVFVQSGFYDGATTYFQAKYTLMQLDPSGRMRDRLSFKGYRSGHMMYLRREDLKQANDDLRAFILGSVGKGSARY